MAMYPASRLGSERHTLSVLVENRPGVLARIAGLFARRAFNINSLSVSPTERPDISRVTVTADVEAVPLEQIIKQLNKLLHVLKIVELDPNTTVERELVLIKVAANESNRSDVLEIVRLFRVRVVDVNPESLTIEATGAEGKIDALLGLLEHYGVIELVRSGAVAVTRGPKALSEKVSLGDHTPTKNLILRITDPELLSKTGGIVQGMSGSPILQDGKLAGAVTHVFVNDPTRGYGIFAENMLDAAR